MNIKILRESLIRIGTIPVLTVITMAGLVARIIFCFYLDLPWFNTDTYSYFQMADGILSGFPISSFPNGYPLIVALVKFLLTEKIVPFSLIFMNVIMSTIIIIMTYLIARKLLSNKLSLIASLVVALWPNQLNYVRQLLSEVPSTFFLIFAVYLLTLRRDLFSLAAGVLFFLSGMIRSTISPVGILLSIYLFIVGQKKKALIVVLGVIAGMIFSNYMYRANYILPSSNLSVNLLLSIKNQSSKGVDWSLRNFTDEQKSNPVKTYISFAVENPIYFVLQRLSALWELWGPWPNSGDIQSPRSVTAKFMIGIRFPALVFAILAVIWLKRIPFVVLCAIPIVVITAVHTAFFSSPRFTYPIEPLLLILAIAGLQEAYRRLRGVLGDGAISL